MCLAVPGRLVRVEKDAGGEPIGQVDFGGIEKAVSLSLVPDVRVGEYVLVHVGLAISRIDEAEAAKVFEYLRQIDALSQELEGPAERPA